MGLEELNRWRWMSGWSVLWSPDLLPALPINHSRASSLFWYWKKNSRGKPCEVSRDATKVHFDLGVKQCPDSAQKWDPSGLSHKTQESTELNFPHIVAHWWVMPTFPLGVDSSPSAPLICYVYKVQKEKCWLMAIHIGHLLSDFYHP